MAELLQLLNEMASNWPIFGLFLGVSDADLAKIDQSRNVADCMDKMLLTWIKFKGEEATMEAILDALDNPPINNRALTERLRKNKRIQETFGWV